MRSVCKRMDLMCGSHLNLGFRNAEKYHTQLMKKFKSREVVPQINIVYRLILFHFAASYPVVRAFIELILLERILIYYSNKWLPKLGQTTKIS